MDEEQAKRAQEIKRNARFQGLTFESFRRRAIDSSLSPNEKIGFPDEYRAGREEAILRDIIHKLPNLEATARTVMDVGPGCARLAHLLIELCGRQGHRLVLIDSAEMLNQIPDEPFIQKIAAYYPRDCRDAIAPLLGKVDILLTYSVFHYVFQEHPFHDFVDVSLQLLAPQGALLIGDIPNVSMRKRFLSSETGARFHKEFTKTTETPSVEFNRVEHGQIDDAVIFDILLRARLAGYDAYVVPQRADLPMANRREDILISRP